MEKISIDKLHDLVPDMGEEIWFWMYEPRRNFLRDIYREPETRITKL